MREHVLHDSLWGLRQLAAPDKNPRLLFEGGVAAQELNASPLQCLHVSVLATASYLVTTHVGKPTRDE